MGNVMSESMFVCIWVSNILVYIIKEKRKAGEKIMKKERIELNDIDLSFSSFP